MSTNDSGPWKAIGDDELASLVATLILNPAAVGEDMENRVHDRFRHALANLVAEYCGGRVQPLRQTEGDALGPPAPILVAPDAGVPQLEGCVWALAGAPDDWGNAASGEAAAYAAFDPALAARTRADYRAAARQTLTKLAEDFEPEPFVSVTLTHEDWVSEEAFESGDPDEQGTVIEAELVPLSELHRWVREHGTTKQPDPARLQLRSARPTEDRAYFEQGRDRYYVMDITHIDGRTPTAEDARRIIEAAGISAPKAEPALTLWIVTLPWGDDSNEGDYCDYVWAPDQHVAIRSVAEKMAAIALPGATQEEREDWAMGCMESGPLSAAERVEERIAEDLRQLLAGGAAQDGTKRLTIEAFLERHAQAPVPSPPAPTAG